uniref:Growth factor receptor domain-containing protein n=1 Tax=Mycena chlorophos TaxID=658473 RepID=A0ABQ0LIR4_MYCCL|nr:growth factor receptor domain-containing protein [Mycena chlorophos]
MLIPLLRAATNTSTIICAVGACLQGYSNTSIGVTISSPGSQSALLLPGSYTSTTNPQFLHNLLTSSSPNLTSSPGFKNSTLSTALPLDVVQEAGLSIYADPLYGGQAAFSTIPSAPVNGSTPLSSRALGLSSSVWIAVNSPASPNSRVIIWDSVPDTAQLPTSAPAPGTLTLFDIESAACNPSCSSGGVCSATDTCACSPGFSGPSCEVCASGFFGPTCSGQCPSSCSKCDDGLTGTGKCLVQETAASCNCVNGVCQADGSCACATGWTTASNGTACAQVESGFFLTDSGATSICAIGCSACEDGTGICSTCKSGFTLDANDKTRCDVVAQANSGGTTCPPGSFADGASCSPCSSTCDTCTGPTANDCVQCATGTYTLNNNTCVSADSNGVCEGTSLIANNNKFECDSCGSTCTSCKIPNFNTASTLNQLQCTACITGFSVSNGTCVSECPSGTFDRNGVCTACDSSCGTCSGSATFCLSCANNQLASNGTCVSSCPSNTFPSSSGSCISCHPDCLTCTGTSFTQCSTCPASRPVLSTGRCLPTCSKTEFFDSSSGTCQSCDPSCSSCSGAGPSQCLACASDAQVLRSGTCVKASCDQVVPGLGACLSEFVTVPSSSGASPLPSVSGLTTPTASTGPRRLAWWEILLMALGCAFIFVVIVWLWRRRAQKKQRVDPHWRSFKLRARYQARPGWRGRLLDLAERVFTRRQRTTERVVTMNISRPLDLEMASSNPKLVPVPVPQPQRWEKPGRGRGREEHQRHLLTHSETTSQSLSDHSAPSIYSQVTGVPPRMPEPRQPVRAGADPRFSSTSTSTIATYYMTTAPVPPLPRATNRERIQRF